uniref:Uncharacterized protein n=1 Tax=viral metagenome TaxID=1070528 RepID=A0A6M3JUM6_9ZZZZ
MFELDNEPIHGWFNLTYASYLVLPRSILQSAPVELQRRFVGCLEELESIFGDVPTEGCYDVRLRDDNGRFMCDHFKDYERGRRRLCPSNLRR